MHKKFARKLLRIARSWPRFRVLPPQKTLGRGSATKITAASLCRRIPILCLLWDRGALSLFRPILTLLGWAATLVAVCAIYPGALSNGPYCRGVLECWGILDNFVFPAVIALLGLLVFAIVRMLKGVERALNTGLDVFFAIDVGKHGLAIESLRTEIRNFVDRISLRDEKARHRYVLLILAMAGLVVGFQIVTPFNFDKPSWALRPREYPIVFGFAIVWAFFYWIVIVANAFWISATSTIGIFGLVRRLSKNSKFIVIPLTTYIQRCFGSFIGLAAWNSFALTLIGALVALLTLKLYKDSYTILALVFCGLMMPTLVLVVPLLAVRRAIRRGRDHYLDQALPPASNLFRSVIMAPEGRGEFSVSDKALLDFLVWERILGRAESVSILFVNPAGFISAVILGGIQLAIPARIILQIGAVYGRY
ncbi:hypothetical protein [Bradyrhizobium sp.]